MGWDERYVEALRPYYHAVATVQELDEVGVDEYGTQRVLGRELLGQRLVIARLDGDIVALNGTCPHRGADLGLGWLSDDGCAVVCRYHGFEWGEYDIDQPDTPMINYGTDAVETARATATFVSSHYDFYAVPSCIHMVKTTGGIRFATLFAMCPISPHRTTAFRIIFPHGDWDVDHEHFQQVEDSIFAEDRLVVESQRPWELKTDLDAELHALMDRPTVAYRRWLAGLGIEYS